MSDAVTKFVPTQVLVVSATGVGAFFAPWGDYAGCIGANVAGTAAANVNRVIQFALPYQITVGRATINVNATSNTNHFYAALYDQNKNFICQFTFTLTAATGALVAILTTPVILPPGIYWLAWGQDNGTVNVLAAGTMSATGAGIFNKNAVRSGISANVQSGGVMPLTLGTITAQTNQNPAAVLLEP